MEAIIEQHPNAQLVLAGKGDDMPRLLDIAQNQSAAVQQAIFMPGFVSDDLLHQLYQTCYMFAMPSRGEGFGLVYLEAMRYAKPCLGSRTDASAYVIRNGETGLLAHDPSSVSDVTDKLLQILESPERAKEMGDAGYKLLCNYYLYPHFRERFWDAVRL